MIEDEVVFGWAVHYFEEDSIHEKLFKEDGTEYLPKANQKKPSKTEQEDDGEDFNGEEVNAPAKKNPKKNGNAQLNLFDMLG